MLYRLLCCAVVVLSACAPAPQLLPLEPTTLAAPLAGTVQALDGTPVADATVYVSQTALHTTTDAEGRFAFPRVPLGHYELLVLSEGKLGMAPVRLDAGRGVSGIAVIAVDSGAPSNTPDGDALALFLKHFGGDARGLDLRLDNPEALRLTRTGDGRRWTLAGSSDAPLWFENRRLGYRVGLLLRDFELKRTPSGYYMSYDAVPFFDAFQAEDDEAAAAWMSARNEAFAGSLQHFLAAAARTRTKAQGFDTFSGEAISSSSEMLATSSMQHTSADITVEPAEYLERDGLHFRLAGLDKLKVHYFFRPIDNRYYDFTSLPDTDRVSWITPPDEAIRFTQQGQLLDADDIRLAGYWGLVQVIDMMPLDHASRVITPGGERAVADGPNGRD